MPLKQCLPALLSLVHIPSEQLRAASHVPLARVCLPPLTFVDFGVLSVLRRCSLWFPKRTVIRGLCSRGCAFKLSAPPFYPLENRCLKWASLKP